jgi:pilus assembly protein Flp/PilA
MRVESWKLYIRMQSLMGEEGQDLVEYALIIALLALAATAGLNGLATAVNTGFTNIAATLGTSIA